MHEAINRARLAMQFRREFELCNVQRGETIALLSVAPGATMSRRPLRRRRISAPRLRDVRQRPPIWRSFLFHRELKGGNHGCL